MPPLPEADVHCSRMAQPSETRLISLVPTSWPCGLVTFHLPNQKSNCLNSGARHAGGGGEAGALAGDDDAARPVASRTNKASSSATALSRRILKELETRRGYFLRV